MTNDRQHRIDQLAAIEDRLHKGWDACEAEIDPAKRQRYESVWLTLLGQYQVLHDHLYGTSGKYTMVPRVPLPE